MVPEQTPPAQTSPELQLLPSSQAKPSRAGPSWAQPVAGTHESTVQEFVSSQLGAAPPMQTFAPLQVSDVVHALPSSHDAPLAFG
jgi:hypothetical protein